MAAKQARIVTPAPPYLTVRMSCAAMHYGQTSLHWSCLSIGRGFRSRVVHSDPTLRNLFCCHDFLLATLKNKLYLFSLFLHMRSWISAFNIVTEGFRVWDAAPGVFCNFLEHCLTLRWLCCSGKKIGNCLPPVTNLSHCTMMDFKLFVNGHIILPLMGRDKYFS